MVVTGLRMWIKEAILIFGGQAIIRFSGPDWNKALRTDII